MKLPRPITAAILLLVSLFAPTTAGYQPNWDVLTHPIVKSFAWRIPFPDDDTHPGGFDVPCEARATFRAKHHRLSSLRLDPPLGLAPWADSLHVFLGRRDYVGSWDGVDHGGDGREVLVMEYRDVPEAVREWVEGRQAGEGAKEEEKWLFGVFEKPKAEGEKVIGTVKARPSAGADGGETEEYKAIPAEDKIMVFSPGALYEILPLWVAKGSKCEADLLDLTKYATQAKDHAVLAWPIAHTRPEPDDRNRDASFTIKAMLVTETDHGKTMRLMWERLHRTVRRTERKIQKEKRAAAGRELRDTRVRDEL